MIHLKLILSLASAVTIFTYDVETASETVEEICPNITANVSSPDISKVVGLWYLYSARPNFLEQDSKCVFVDISFSDETAFVRRYETSRSTNQVRVSDGYVTAGPEPGQLNFHYIVPLEYTHTNTFLGGSLDSHAAVYSCSSCSDFGDKDLGVHPYIWTRVRKPNCTVTSGAMEIFDSFNISTEAVSQIEQDDCTI